MEIEKITQSLNGYLNEYRTFPQIQTMLKFCGIEINEREFADYVELYRQQDNEYYLESCNCGYRFTRDVNAIQKSCYQRIKKALSMLNNAKRDLKYCGDRKQIALIDNFINDYESQISVAESVN